MDKFWKFISCACIYFLITVFPFIFRKHEMTVVVCKVEKYTRNAFLWHYWKYLKSSMQASQPNCDWFKFAHLYSTVFFGSPSRKKILTPRRVAVLLSWCLSLPGWSLRSMTLSLKKWRILAGYVSFPRVHLWWFRTTKTFSIQRDTNSTQKWPHWLDVSLKPAISTSRWPHQSDVPLKTVIFKRLTTTTTISQ